MYVSKHWGARNTGIGHANHEQWQGKVYFIKDGTNYSEEAKRIGQDYITNLWYATGYSADGERVNDPLGLNGYNCRHHHYVWFEGVSELPKETPEPKPVTINGKTYDYYSATQKMRSMERDIRALKREKEALGKLGMDTKEIQAKIRKKTSEYHQFCKDAGINAKNNRLMYEAGTADIKKTEAYSSYSAMRNYGALNDVNDPYYEKRMKHAEKYYEEIRNRQPRYIIQRLAKNAGIHYKSAEAIYRHIFIDEHLFENGEMRRFDPNYDMAESFRRLLEGKNIKEHDLVMIKHERLELNLMKRYNIPYEVAHRLANQKYNYKVALDKFLERLGS